MTEREDVRMKANQILERQFADPDDDLAILSRQLLRADEALIVRENSWVNTCDALSACEKERDALRVGVKLAKAWFDADEADLDACYEKDTYDAREAFRIWLGEKDDDGLEGNRS